MRKRTSIFIGLTLMVLVAGISWTYFPTLIQLISNKGETRIILYANETVDSNHVKETLSAIVAQNESDLKITRTSDVVTVSMPLIEISQYSEVEMALNNVFEEKARLQGFENVLPTQFALSAFLMPLGLITVFFLAIVFIVKGFKNEYSSHHNPVFTNTDRKES